MVNDLRERVSLRPCPFCGPTRQKPILHKGKGVKCHTCGAWGPAWEKPTGEEWNTRADAALAEIGAVREGVDLSKDNDEALDWITSNCSGVRRDNGNIDYSLGQMIRAFQAGKAAIEPAPVKMKPRASVSPDHAWEPVEPARAIAEGKE